MNLSICSLVVAGTLALAQDSGVPESPEADFLTTPQAPELQLNVELNEGLRALADALDRQPGQRLADEAYIGALRLLREAGAHSIEAGQTALRAIALEHAEGSHRYLSLQAMDTLVRQGMPLDDFAPWVREWRTNPNRALSASWILARSLRADHVQLLTQIAEQAEAGGMEQWHLLAWSAGRCEQAQFLNRAIESTLVFDEQVDWAAAYCLGSHSPFIPTCRGIEAAHDFTDPVTVIARGHLDRLSSSAPAASVQALRAGELRDQFPSAAVPDEVTRQRILDDLRDHAAAHLASEARQIYATQRPGAFDHSGH